VEKDLSAEELFARKKFRLAEIGKQLLENPESSITSLKELLEICNDEDHNIVVLGLFSMLAVFRDIIPGYYFPSSLLPFHLQACPSVPHESCYSFLSAQSCLTVIVFPLVIFANAIT